ncbi:MAG: Zn-ribbon domain-containing OB-fold protein [Candidatus Odinarchaeota archaeon]
MNNEEIIEWKKCNNCGFLQYKTHLRCLKCKFDKFSTIKASGQGKLLTFTILTAPPTEFRDQESYALGLLEFENGIKVIGQITSQKNLKTGMKLRPVYKKICNNLDGNEVYTHVFEPIKKKN